MSKPEKVNPKTLTRVLGVEKTKGPKGGARLRFKGYDFCPLGRERVFRKKKFIDTNGELIKVNGKCQEFRCPHRKSNRCNAYIMMCLESDPTRYYISSNTHKLTCVPVQERTTVIHDNHQETVSKMPNYDNLMIPNNENMTHAMFGEIFTTPFHLPNSERNFECDPNLIELPNTPFINDPRPSTFNPNEVTRELIIRTGKKRKLNDVGLTTSEIGCALDGGCCIWIFSSFSQDDGKYIISKVFLVQNGGNRELHVISVRPTGGCNELYDLLASESEEVRQKCLYSQFTILVLSRSSTDDGQVKLLIPNGNTITGTVTKIRSLPQEEEEEPNHRIPFPSMNLSEEEEEEQEEENLMIQNQRPMPPGTDGSLMNPFDEEVMKLFQDSMILSEFVEEEEFDDGPQQHHDGEMDNDNEEEEDDDDDFGFGNLFWDEIM